MLTNKIWRFLSIPAVKTGYVALMVLGLPCEHMSRCMFAINWFRIFFHLQGNLGQAEVIGREALRLLPKDHTIMFSLANVLGKLQKYKVSQLSMNILTHNVAFFSVHADNFKFIGHFSCQIYSQEWIFLFCPQESEGFFLRALQINPNAASCHGNLGELLQLWFYHVFYGVGKRLWALQT